ncbi:ABC transporter substrate-binding protein [Thiorhodovibrio frisius]|uniref:Thiamine pyrimidine synthase n=1 Tax=Thiorhodovibrio frisius TaxID=631362 RepID=H8Z2B8_9GAMM|nr:ABC transporter substrate-binding protein [Thiorhodovibrio frisius]EIC22680.1 ABC-type nitrate/sulfonate/bicarbonate transport system, periplasmic component [Thiorhodovibrio frisius]WPL22436.1 NMT1/THI5 like protein [Thiorhodovibrio frisius]
MLASSLGLAESPLPAAVPAPIPAPQDGDNPLTSVRIALQWSPQSQFAGFYLAREQGFYAAAGADVRFVHTNANRSSLDWLLQGDAELATAFLADAMVAAANADSPDDDAGDAPGEQSGDATRNDSGDDSSDNMPGLARPVLIGQLVQRSNLMLLAWKDHGIEHLEDLNGQRISLWPGPFTAAIQALLTGRQITPELIPQYGTVNLFLHGGVSACAAMEYNEYHRIWQAGIDEDRLTAFLLRDFGFDFPEDGLYARSDWLEEHSDLPQRLWQATLKGWEYARTHPQQAIDLVMAEAERAGVPSNRPHQGWMLDHILGSIFVENDSTLAATGQLAPGAYAATAQALIAAGLLTKAPPFGVFCPGCRLQDEGPPPDPSPEPSPGLPSAPSNEPHPVSPPQ